MFCCGGSTRTNDLKVMSLASYQLLHSAMFQLCFAYLRSIALLFSGAKVGLLFSLCKYLRHKPQKHPKKIAIFYL